MSVAEQQDHLEFEGEPVRQSRLTFKGSVMGPAFHRGEEIALVATAKVAGVAFDDVKDVATRTHKAPVSKARVIDTELAQDLLDEQHERDTGQLKLLSTEGESRRAARAVLETRQAILGARVDVIEDEDGNEEPTVFVRAAADGPLSVLYKLVAEADTYDLDEWLKACEAELVTAGAALVAGIEWCRRRQAEHEASVHEAAVAEAREEARRVAEAAAVHNDEEADKRERRGVEGTDEGDDE